VSHERQFDHECRSCRTRCLLSCLLALGVAVAAPAAELQVQGGWDLTLDGGALIWGAGSDLGPALTSDPAAITVSVINTGGNAWTLSARRASPGWPHGLALNCRRTGEGLGALPLRGGAGFVPITDGPQVLFAGTGDALVIPLQLQVAGLTVRLGLWAHDLSLVLRVEETP